MKVCVHYNYCRYVCADCFVENGAFWEIFVMGRSIFGWRTAECNVNDSTNGNFHIDFCFRIAFCTIDIAEALRRVLKVLIIFIFAMHP